MSKLSHRTRFAASVLALGLLIAPGALAAKKDKDKPGKVTAVPELDAAHGVLAGTLLAGAFVLLTRRRDGRAGA